MTRRVKSKPQIKKREAMQLAQQAESDPLGVLQQIAERERHTVASISIWGGHGKEWEAVWRCSLSFSGATYAAGGKGVAVGEAVKQAVLRAYDTGDEKDWQLRDKSFQAGGLT